MSKRRSTFICSNCGKRSPAFFGRCPQCRQFDTMVEQLEEARQPSGKPALSPGGAQPAATLLSEVVLEADARIPVPIAEFSRVLGGGLVPGSMVLLGGEPGIGKSTLVLELSALLARANGEVLYVSGEESAGQIKLRADRLGLAAPGLYLLTETDLDQVIQQVTALEPALVVIDSIQTMRAAEMASSPGLVSQVRECAIRLQELAKRAGVSILLIGHVTKDGHIAGPRALEHIVDVVLMLEGDPFRAISALARGQESLRRHQRGRCF